MPQKPAEWCLFDLSPCLPSSEWAAWAQAIFSAAAVLAAIGVVWWQLRVSRQKSKEAARLVASGLLTIIDQAIAGLLVVAQGLEECISGKGDPGNSPRHLADILGTLSLPSKDDLLILNAGLPSCSTRLLRASNSARQVQTALEFMAKIGTPGANDSSLAELCTPLYKLARDAANSFGEAKQELDRFCPP